LYLLEQVTGGCEAGAGPPRAATLKSWRAIRASRRAPSPRLWSTAS